MKSWRKRTKGDGWSICLSVTTNRETDFNYLKYRISNCFCFFYVLKFPNKGFFFKYVSYFQSFNPERLSDFADPPLDFPSVHAAVPLFMLYGKSWLGCSCCDSSAEFLSLSPLHDYNELGKKKRKKASTGKDVKELRLLIWAICASTQKTPPQVIQSANVTDPRLFPQWCCDTSLSPPTHLNPTFTRRFCCQ